MRKNTMLDDEKILSVKSVSETLNVGKNTIYSLLETGELRGFKVKKLWRVCSSDVDTFIKEHYTVSGQA